MDNITIINAATGEPIYSTGSRLTMDQTVTETFSFDMEDNTRIRIKVESDCPSTFWEFKLEAPPEKKESYSTKRVK